MLVLRKRKHKVPTLIFLLLIAVSKSTSDEGLQAKDDADNASPSPVTAGVQDRKSAEKDNNLCNSEDNTNEDAPDKEVQQENENEKEEKESSKSEESKQRSQEGNSDTKQNIEKEEDEPNTAGSKEEKLEDDESSEVAEPTKKQKVQNEEDSRKISLSDVNSITIDESHEKQAKRETRITEFLGLPRDASYFFDDLEPYINNNSIRDNSQENARAARAVSRRDSKAQKAKTGGKKGIMEVEEEDEDDIEKVEEEEKNEGDYDEDEDLDSDCQPTTDSCTSSTVCTKRTTQCTRSTAHQCTTKCTTTQKCTTPKCTTRAKCTTQEECTRCPKICVKANRKFMGYRPTTVRRPEWDDLQKKDARTTVKAQDSSLFQRKLHGSNPK